MKTTIFRLLLFLLLPLALLAQRRPTAVDSFSDLVNLIPSPGQPDVIVVQTNSNTRLQFRYYPSASDSTNAATPYVFATSTGTGRWKEVPLTGTTDDIVLSGSTRFDGQYSSSVPITGDTKISLINSSPLAPLLQETLSSVPTISSLTNSDYQLFNGYNIVNVEGYYTANDGGGGQFRRALDVGQTIDNGIYFAFYNSPGWILERITGGEPINIKWFGAKGDGATDDTAAIQAAIDYAETVGGNVFVPPCVGTNVFRASSLTVTSCEFSGIRTQQERITLGSSIILQTASPTNSLIIVGNDGLKKPNIHDLTLVGYGDVTTPNKVAITAVGGRLEFSVATNNAPTLANAPGFFAQVAMLYTSEDRYLGSAAVTGIATVGTNCVVTLDERWDNYANIEASGTVLDTTCKVVFAPIVTSSGVTYADAGGAGYAGISISGALGPRIADVTINKFHAGIHISASTTPLLVLDGTIKINYCEFAGLAAPLPLSNPDFTSSGIIWVSGGYIRPAADIISYTAETLTITNSLARNTSFGFYNPWAIAHIGDMKTDQCVVGYYSAREINNAVDYMFLDNCVRHGLASLNGRFDHVGGSGSWIGNLQIKGWFLSTNTTPSFWTNKVAVMVTGSTLTNELMIDSIAIPKWTGSTVDDFEYAFDISGLAHEVVIGKRLGDLSGADALYGSTTYPPRWLNPFENIDTNSVVTGWFSTDGKALSYAANTTNTVTLAHDAVTVRRRLAVTPAEDLTNVVSVANSAGTVLARVDSTNGRTYLSNDGEGADPSFNSGTALVVKNNSYAAARSRIAVVAGASAFATVELGSASNLPAGLQYDVANSTLNINNSGVNAIRLQNYGVTIADNTLTISNPDTTSVLELQSTNRALRLPIIAGNPSATVAGQLWYNTNANAFNARYAGENTSLMRGDGYKTIVIPASFFAATATSPATATTRNNTTNNTTDSVWSFSGSADNYITCSFPMPEKWDGTTLKAKFFWRSASTSTNAFIWNIASVLSGSGDNPDITLGTAQSVTNAGFTTAYLQNISSATGTIDPSGDAFAVGDTIRILVGRDGDGDGNTDAALLEAVVLQYRETATEPSAW